MSYRENQEKTRERLSFHTIRDISMGVLYLFMGGMLLAAKKMGIVELQSTVAYILGTIIVIYGIFRLYRGIVVVLPGKKK